LVLPGAVLCLHVRRDIVASSIFGGAQPIMAGSIEAGSPTALPTGALPTVVLPDGAALQNDLH
jgi:hypothetical protein